jgi:hypothetical protein
MKKVLLKMIPAPARKKVFELMMEYFKGWARQISAKIPKYELEKIHIRNTKLVVNREALLELLPKNGVVAEIGVDQGDFSELILRTSKPSKLHLVDIWGSERYGQDKRRSVEAKFEREIGLKEVEINYGLSTEVVNKFPDNYFDWIYLDSDHSYKNVKEELEAYNTKVKEGGMIAGHDFITANWNGMRKFGVIEAVYEFCVKYNWEIVYLTVENKFNPSFAIRKIQ